MSAPCYWTRIANSLNSWRHSATDYISAGVPFLNAVYLETCPGYPLRRSGGSDSPSQTPSVEAFARPLEDCWRNGRLRWLLGSSQPATPVSLSSISCTFWSCPQQSVLTPRSSLSRLLKTSKSSASSSSQASPWALRLIMPPQCHFACWLVMLSSCRGGSCSAELSAPGWCYTPYVIAIDTSPVRVW